jgi:predicted small lipoprotein YifL
MHCWPRYLLWLVIAVLGAGNMLAACGRSGPLYLPDEPRPAQGQPAPAVEDDDRGRVPENKY